MFVNLSNELKNWSISSSLIQAANFALKSFTNFEVASNTSSPLGVSLIKFVLLSIFDFEI